MKMRRAIPADLDGVVKIGLEALNTNPLPGCRISVERVRNVAREIISGAGDYACVVVDDAGEVVGALLAYVHDMAFYERKQATVVQFYCKAPGWGVRMIRDFARWAQARRGIRAWVFSLEHDADPRIGKLLHRLGLNMTLPIWMGVRK